MNHLNNRYYNFSDIFKFELVNDENELNAYLNDGFLTPENNVERIIYIILFIIFLIYGITSLTFFYLLRESYIIRQRGFSLTFSGGILTLINIIFGFIPQITEVPCAFTLFSANVINVAVNFIFLTRSYRVIFNYHFNIYKVSSINNKKIKGTYDASIEPNSYLPKINRRINKLLFMIVVIPVLIAIFATLVIYFKYHEKLKNDCPLFGNYERSDAMLALKHNTGKELFRVVVFYGILFFVLSFINTIGLYFVKDANKYGIKFECMSVSIMVIVFNIINIVVQIFGSTESDAGNLVKNEKKYKAFLAFFEKTKGGKILFTIVQVYMLFVSISLPVIHYYKARFNKNSYFQDENNIEYPSGSIQYFYKVLNTASLVNDLKSIAIKEFSVENVLFWENYQILQKMVYRYQVEFKKAMEMGDEHLVAQYDFEGYYQKIQQQNSSSSSSMNEYSYDPNMPVPIEIMPYYTAFYHMFIDFNGPAVVNLPGSTVERIFNEICTYPTIGIYDTAKNEVVEMMYSSIYPILLRKDGKHLTKTLG